MEFVIGNGTDVGKVPPGVDGVGDLAPGLSELDNGALPLVLEPAVGPEEIVALEIAAEADPFEAILPVVETGEIENVKVPAVPVTNIVVGAVITPGEVLLAKGAIVLLVNDREGGCDESVLVKLPDAGMLVSG